MFGIFYDKRALAPKLGPYYSNVIGTGSSDTRVGVAKILLLPTNRFPLIINDVPPPPVIINNPGGQKLCIIRGAYLLKGFGRAALKFLLKAIEIDLKSR